MNAISDLYEGEKRYNETRFKNKAYSLNYAALDNLRETLGKSLTEENKELLDEIFEKFCNIEFEYGREMFITGFSLGVQLTAESLCKNL